MLGVKIKIMKEILQQLISFKTTHEEKNKKDFDKAFEWIIKKSRKYIFDYKLIIKNDYKNLIIFKSKQPTVILVTHIDVVPAKTDDFILKETKTKFIGRGVYDMKFAIASGLKLLQELPSQAKFALVITSDEEIGGFNGVGYLAKYLVSLGKVFIIPDGGYNFNLETEAKGILHLKLNFFGKKAHASTPWKGKSAFDEFFKGYYKLRKIFKETQQETFKPTLNIGKIQGGSAINQVMDYLEVFLDIRFPKKYQSQKILNLIKKFFPDAKVNILVSGEAIKINFQNTFLQQWIKITKEIIKKEIKFTKSFGASDARFLSPFNVPLVITRPKGGNHHGENEWLDKKSFFQFYEILRSYILKYS